MAKIRTLKAEFFRSADISRGGPWAKVLAAGLICAVADDDGRFKAGLDDLKGEIFTHDHITPDEIASALQSLAQEDFIRLYKDHAKHFGVVLNWKDHQPVPPTRYKPSKFPAPPNTKVRRHSEAERKHGADTSKQTPSDASSCAEYGIGKEGNRKGRDISPVASGRELAVFQPDPIAQIFEAWTRSTGRSARTLLDGKRRRVIQHALAAYPVEDLLLAVDGWRFSAHHRGENDRATKYNDLELLLRDAKHIEMFRDLAQGGSPVIPLKPSASRGFREAAAALRAGGMS